MVYRVSTCCYLLLCVVPFVLADDEFNSTAFPSLDFLEFIGEWETEQGEWIDPEILEINELEQLVETKAEIKKSIDNEN